MTRTSTLRQYQAAWRDFERACREGERAPLPATPETIQWYLTRRALTLTKSTRRKRIAAIRFFHRQAGYEAPLSGGTWDEDIQITHGLAVHANASQRWHDLAALLTDTQRALVRQCDRSTATGLRDATLLLLMVGFDLSREACSGLDRQDLKIKDGSVSLIDHSQTKRAKHGRFAVQSSVPEFDPVRPLSRWLEKASIKQDALFRSIDRHGNVGGRLSGRSIYNIVRHRAEILGIAHFTPMMLRRVPSK